MVSLYFCKNILFLVLLIIYCYIIFYNKEDGKQIVSHPSRVTSLSSSVFCSLHKNNSKRCFFKNLCYNFYSKFLFLLTEKSIISSLNGRDDFKSIFATSVLNHSALPLKISVVYAKNFSDLFIYERDVFLLHRFKPDNIMHVVHDDILPLFATYRDLCFGNVSNCASKYDLLFSDDNIEGTFIEWYRPFSKNEPFQLSKMDKSITYCFSKINVGLSIDSVIFQYGFLQNRGSTELSVHQVKLLKQFRTYMLNHFEINNPDIKLSVVFVGRKLNRKILNEDYVESIILETFRNKFNYSVNLLNMDLSINSSKEMLLAVAQSNYLIGIHGSGMFLSMFLPENSVVIEMFPYGIDKEKVSPIFVMSLMPGIWFRYFSWENIHSLNSFPHPEYAPIFGGLTHLIREEQLSVFNENVNNVSMECCNDPFFLSRMYQDTIIDESFIKTLSIALKTVNEYKTFDLDKVCMDEWFFPGVVENVTCYRNDSDLLLSWVHPFNVDIYNNATYNIAIETSKQNISVLTNTYFVNLKLESELSNVIKLWIKCCVLGIEGLDTFITC